MLRPSAAGLPIAEFFLALITSPWCARRSLPALAVTGYADFPGLSQVPADVAVLLKPIRRRDFVLRVLGLLNPDRLAPKVADAGLPWIPVS